MPSDFLPAPIPNGRRNIDGQTYMHDARGGLQPVETIRAQHLLEDETVRKIMGYGVALSDQVARFKEHTFEDIGALEAVLAQEYNAMLGGKKGNMTLMTVDGLFKVAVAVQDRVDFGPELQTAKTLFDECLNEWASGTRAEVRQLVQDAFNTDKEGTINRSLIFTLLRSESEDVRWQRAQDAIRAAMRVISTKTYVRCYRRDSHDADWRAVTIDLAKA